MKKLISIAVVLFALITVTQAGDPRESFSRLEYAPLQEWAIFKTPAFSRHKEPGTVELTTLVQPTVLRSGEVWVVTFADLVTKTKDQLADHYDGKSRCVEIDFVPIVSANAGPWAWMVPINVDLTRVGKDPLTPSNSVLFSLNPPSVTDNGGEWVVRFAADFSGTDRQASLVFMDHLLMLSKKRNSKVSGFIAKAK